MSVGSTRCVICGKTSIFGIYKGGMCMTCADLLEENMKNKKINKDIDSMMAGIDPAKEQAPMFIRNRAKERRKFRFIKA